MIIWQSRKVTMKDTKMVGKARRLIRFSSHGCRQRAATLQVLHALIPDGLVHARSTNCQGLYIHSILTLRRISLRHRVTEPTEDATMETLHLGSV